jgi:hypothetical protein
MNDLSTRLRDADPLGVEPALTAESREAMRRAIVAAAGAPALRIPQWRQPLALAAMTVLAVFGVAAAHRFAERRQPDIPVALEAAAPPTTQVHFRTPGGTRIIWTLDPAFHLGGTRR